MNEPQIVQLFSQPLYINKVNITQTIIDNVINTPMLSDNGGYKNGSMSETQWLTSQPEIRTIVEDHLSEYIFGVLAIDSNKHKIELSSSWVNLHKPYDSGVNHSHSNAMYSGVMYFKTPPNSGDIVFKIPAMYPTFCSQTLYPEVVDYNQYNMREARITPQEGMIMCFPSHLSHSVYVNESNEDRYSMAFNYILRGEYGRDDHYLKL